MTNNEKNQLIKGLFLTTGIVLGVVSNQLIDGTGGILFALLSAALFLIAFYTANKMAKNKLLYYIGAIAVWLIVYKLFQTM